MVAEAAIGVTRAATKNRSPKGVPCVDFFRQVLSPLRLRWERKDDKAGNVHTDEPHRVLVRMMFHMLGGNSITGSQEFFEGFNSTILLKKPP